MLSKRWTLKTTNDVIANQLQSELKVHPTICQMLAQRGIKNYNEAKQYFRNDSTHLHSPFLMKGMQHAVERIHKAVVAKERILIYGDYDVDGTTAVAIVFQYFKKQYLNIHPNQDAHIEYYIPHRFTEGYGVSKKGMEYAIEKGFTLIITLDCGIKSSELIEVGNAYNIDTIICDHHLPGDVLPNAFAILNPKQLDCPYPYKELCGCGIGYKLITAYAELYNNSTQETDELIDLVATAIAADIVPITGENRTLSILGLQKANQNPSIPIQALKQISTLEREFTITDLVFVIAPRVNAAGRMDDAKKAVELFIETDIIKAKELANILQEDNLDRRDIDKTITAEALDLIQQNDGLKATVLYQPHWHKGVVGIVASRLMEHHYRPTIVLTESNGKITGSARSIKGFNLFEGLNQCAQYLETYGGHYFAAGVTLASENLTSFTQRFNEVVQQTVPEQLFVPEIEIDAEINFNDITPTFINILNQFAPFGPENMKPIFLAKQVKDYQGLSQIVKEKHIRFVLFQSGSKTMNGIGFNLAEKLPIIKSKKSFDVLFQIEENNWQGNKSIQLKILDLQ